MSTREAGQSRESAAALNVYMEAGWDTSAARTEVRGLLRQLKEARKAVKLAEAAEAAALTAYESTPYSENA